MTGSHLDTQPTGGKFDGVYGVLAGLEVVRTLTISITETEAPVELVVWTNEEGSRFSPAMIGSGVYAGIFSLEQGLATPDNVTGVTMGASSSASASPGPRNAAGRRSPPISRRISSRGRSSRRRKADRHRPGRPRPALVRDHRHRPGGACRADADEAAQRTRWSAPRA